MSKRAHNGGSGPDHRGRLPRERASALRSIQAPRPAGTLHLPRRLLPADTREVLDLVHETEEDEMRAYPSERLLDVVADQEGLTVTTSGVYLAGVLAGRLERHLQRPARVQFHGPDGVSVVWE